MGWGRMDQKPLNFKAELQWQGLGPWSPQPDPRTGTGDLTPPRKPHPRSCPLMQGSVEGSQGAATACLGMFCGTVAGESSGVGKAGAITWLLWCTGDPAVFRPQASGLSVPFGAPATPSPLTAGGHAQPSPGRSEAVCRSGPARDLRGMMETAG
ncbi:hypothetical protein NDU88_002127 [Pleurodeles waltl]|uniref:Uncharacterized protein n=1 Tax=Pleurodeles waltl TaxID=8319 RepID=A0AAV7LCY6_PLEWA|nr:hypothetical protein NDU88_002127 [Pleurodeles waltl]